MAAVARPRKVILAVVAGSTHGLTTYNGRGPRERAQRTLQPVAEEPKKCWLGWLEVSNTLSRPYAIPPARSLSRI